MATVIQTTGGFLRAMKVTYWALFLGQFTFAGLTFYLNVNNPIQYGEHDPNDVFSYIVPMMVLGGLIGGHFLSKTAIQKAKEKPTFKEKLESYRSALIIRYALMEGPNLFCIVAYLLSSNIVFMYIAIAVMLVYLFSFPKTVQLISDLELNGTEIEQLNDPLFQLN